MKDLRESKLKPICANDASNNRGDQYTSHMEHELFDANQEFAEWLKKNNLHPYSEALEEEG